MNGASVDSLPDDWEVRPFSEVFNTVSGGSYLKQSDYAEKGSIPVVDQGQSEIGGYTGDDSLVCDVALPCIVFGDHTRIFKYVDFPFVVGAQGTKVLSPVDDVDTRYAYHYLLALRLPNEGYSRHFKFLKEKTIVMPPLDEQRRIAEILDRADAIRAKRRRAQSLLDELIASLLTNAGCAPITTKTQFPTATADEWRWVALSDVARLESGHTPSRRNEAYWGGDVQWLSLKDVSGFDRVRIHETQDHPTPLGISKSSARLLPKDTVALCRTASVGKTVIFGTEMATSQDFVNWVCGPDLLPEFLYAIFLASQQEFKKEMQGSTHKTIYMPTVKRFGLLLPPMDVQRRIADAVSTRDRFLSRLREAESRADDLYHALAQRTFRGELIA